MNKNNKRDNQGKGDIYLILANPILPLSNPIIRILPQYKGKKLNH